jgi:hypothetical protein
MGLKSSDDVERFERYVVEAFGIEIAAVSCSALSRNLLWVLDEPALASTLGRASLYLWLLAFAWVGIAILLWLPDEDGETSGDGEGSLSGLWGETREIAAERITTYVVFRPGYVAHEISHYLAARLLGGSAAFGLDDDGRPWVDVSFTEPSLGRLSAVGLAPCVSGLVFLSCLLWAYVGPLGDVGAGNYLVAPVFVYLLGNAYVWTAPSPEDLAPVRILLARLVVEDRPALDEDVVDAD